MNGSRDLIVSSLAHRHLIIATPAPRTAKETEPVKHSDTKIGTLTADKFREKLKKGKIRSPENSLKPNLQVLYKTRNRDEEEATDESSEEDVEAEEEQEDEETVSGAYEEEEIAKAKSVRKTKEEASNRASTSKAANQDRELPTSVALNLFLTMLHGHLGRTQTAPLLRNSSITSPKSLLSLLKKLPRLKTTKGTARSFDKNVSKTTAQVLSAIHNLYADMIVIAPADLRVELFPEEILQSVVARPTDELRVKVDVNGGDSRKTGVYFHGTSIGSLHSILFDGFKAPTGSLWLAQQPGYSCYYAFKRTNITPGFEWNAVPFSNHRATMECF
ncbi:hypothetical protein IFR04_008221 [Cadophora malorum]|uniref:Uncharacterized protein n=1 Tax=Cadophora malorum TaxID=108018 RepID=A0A8H7TGF5_9HELO|nr:hypothetical protein IFR04_008221 [Cadophora malorum]